MKKIVLAAGILVALVAVVAVAGCIGSDPIVGTWSASTGLKVGSSDLLSSSMTFNGDGTGTSTGAVLIFSADSTFNWKKVSDGKYAITYGDTTKEVSVTFGDDGKTMKFDGATYKKVES